MQLSIDHKAFDKFLMVGDKVLVKPTNPQVKTRSGLLLPPLVQEGEKLQTGYVIRATADIRDWRGFFADTLAWSGLARLDAVITG